MKLMQGEHIFSYEYLIESTKVLKQLWRHSTWFILDGMEVFITLGVCIEHPVFQTLTNVLQCAA